MSGTLAIIGLDSALTKRVAKLAFDALRFRYDYTTLRGTKRGYSFTVLEEGGREMRVTVEMLPWNPATTDDVPSSPDSPSSPTDARGLT